MDMTAEKSIPAGLFDRLSPNPLINGRRSHLTTWIRGLGSPSVKSQMPGKPAEGQGIVSFVID